MTTRSLCIRPVGLFNLCKDGFYTKKHPQLFRMKPSGQIDIVTRSLRTNTSNVSHREPVCFNISCLSLIKPYCMQFNCHLWGVCSRTYGVASVLAKFVKFSPPTKMEHYETKTFKPCHKHSSHSTCMRSLIKSTGVNNRPPDSWAIAPVAILLSRPERSAWCGGSLVTVRVQ